MLRSVKRRESRDGHRKVAVLVTVAVVALLSLAGVGTAIISQATQPAAAPPPGAGAVAASAGMARSVPTRLRIPAIGVDSALGSVGLQADGKTMQLPTSAMQVDWYDDSPTPGEDGTAIVVGYIQDGREPGAFSRLAALRAGQQIGVARQDGSTASFRVDRVEQYPHGQFPASQVYAATATPTLRIVTVGGVLRAGDQPGNVVVYAHLVQRGPGAS